MDNNAYYCICACDGQYEAHANSIKLIIKCERNVVWVASKSLLGPQTVYMYAATNKKKTTILCYPCTCMSSR